MKKSIPLFLLFILFLFSSSSTQVNGEYKILTQGLYNIKDLQFSTNIIYNIRNTCPTNKSLIIVFDSNNAIQQLIRLEPNSPKYHLKELNSDDLILIIGAANIEFS